MKKETVLYLTYLFLLCISSFTLVFMGYDITTWQWWVMELSFIVSHYLGRDIGNGGDGNSKMPVLA